MMGLDGGRRAAQLVPHRMLVSVRRGLERLATRAVTTLGARRAVQWQRLTHAGRQALHEIARRWPQLAALLDGTVTQSTKSTERAAPSSPSREERIASLETLRSSSDVTERVLAADSLARFVDEETTRALVAALRDRSSEVAVQAAEGLGLHGGPVAESGLREVLANADRYFLAETRAAAVHALGAILPPGKGQPIDVAVTDPEAVVSLAAIATLAERDEPVGTEALMAVIERPDGFYLPVTRQSAARALSRMHDLDVVRMRTLAAREVDPEVRSVLASVAG